jgi:heat shock protein HslJ
MRLTLIIAAYSISILSAAFASEPLGNLAGSEWGFPGEQGPHARYIHFAANGQANGFSGCNQFSGRFDQSGDSLRIGPLATTRKACRPDVMKLEQVFFKVLDRARRMKATHLELLLRSEDGAELIRLTRRDFD